MHTIPQIYRNVNRICTRVQTFAMDPLYTNVNRICTRVQTLAMGGGPRLRRLGSFCPEVKSNSPCPAGRGRTRLRIKAPPARPIGPAPRAKPPCPISTKSNPGFCPIAYGNLRFADKIRILYNWGGAARLCAPLVCAWRAVLPWGCAPQEHSPPVGV